MVVVSIGNWAVLSGYSVALVTTMAAVTYAAMLYVSRVRHGYQLPALVLVASLLGVLG